MNAYSKWIDVFEISEFTAAKTVVEFRQYFCTWRLPTLLVTDIGSCFINSLKIMALSTSQQQCTCHSQIVLQRTVLKHLKLVLGNKY
ncbi:hypothetical protein PR048_005532 [Dryococelus australis]|uniref:Transposase n=1 Tax=Dryococelus australis TaxID=614101 RepID=A0ABQ9I8L6_9NEOP|nr:hypothetical protein PR048_005532 [Dryococelus australis]